MALDQDKIKQALKNRKKKSVIDKAINHQLRLRFHSETYLDEYVAGSAVTLFLNWVKTLIPRDKYNIFLSLFQYPTSNIELTEKIFKELERIFDSRNSVFSYQFNNIKWKDDWEYYRQEILKEPTIWKETGWNKMKTAINSLLVIDLPEEQTDSLPSPYFYWLDIENVIDFETCHKGKIEWIIFKQGKDEYVVIDEVNWIKFKYDNVNITDYIEIPHGLGYCPATFFWNDDINSKDKDIKKSPLSTQLSNLDWLLFFSISNKHLNLYAPYPIIVTTESECDYFRDIFNEETGETFHEECNKGYLKDINGNYIITNGGVTPCPICSAHSLAGVGSVITKPVPEGDVKELSKPIEIVTIPRESLDYNNETEESLKDKIYSAVTGIGGSVLESQAVNEKQVSSTFETKTNILISLKTNFEKAQKFVDDTICRLRYGDSFISSNINYGTSFYVFTITDLQNQYKEAKANGADNARLDTIYEQIIELENKNNPTQLQRMLILKQLEPYRHYSIEELKELEDKIPNTVDKELLNIKLNFSSYVDRFERENTNIMEFGTTIPFNKKIDIILNQFKQYGRKEVEGETT